MIRNATTEDSAAVARVHVASWLSTYPGLVPQAVLESLSVERRTHVWQSVLERASEQFIVVATDRQGDVVGFANGGPEREKDKHYTAELYALYLLKSVQGRGEGKALLLAAAEQFSGRGHKAMLLWVLSTNPARGFYEKLGGQQLKSKTLELGGETLSEIAYGWTNLPGLLAKYANAKA